MDDPRKATAMVGGIAGALVIIIVHVLAFYQIEATVDFTGAVTILLTGLIGFFAHSVREDAAALHARILAELRRDLPPVVSPAPAAPLHPIVGGDH